LPLPAQCARRAILREERRFRVSHDRAAPSAAPPPLVQLTQTEHTLFRHARTRSGHPPARHALASGWIAGSSRSSPAMTREINRMRYCASGPRGS
jgi:hypothetical protein